MTLQKNMAKITNLNFIITKGMKGRIRIPSNNVCGQKTMTKHMAREGNSIKPREKNIEKL